ncbi:Hypothetical predicted protein [Cloeon dipterum]|uniref:Uncharacterized protein n=1 Tax=Cloeon dipterum TaxID=197152 RepID=A0A8S1DUV6_9INSE|nr:Hypothetical predicted protein [Cloeon dipterum]
MLTSSEYISGEHRTRIIRASLIRLVEFGAQQLGQWRSPCCVKTRNRRRCYADGCLKGCLYPRSRSEFARSAARPTTSGPIRQPESTDGHFVLGSG